MDLIEPLDPSLRPYQNSDTMRLINGLAAVRRAAAGAESPAQLRPFHAALFRVESAAEPLRVSHELRGRFELLAPPTVQAITGTRFFSRAASSAAQEVRGKEPPQAEKFHPKDVVLYQYEACPFCNKVKGEITVSLLCFLPFC